jgi:hypothetical protein
MATIETAIAERANQQLGLVTTHQLRALDCTAGTVRGLIRRGVLHPEGPGVHRLVGAPCDARTRLLAACLAAGPPAVASFDAAAALWQYPTTDEPPVELTTTVDRRPRIKARIHRSSDLVPRDCTMVGPIPATDRVRTLIDCAGTWSERRMEHVVDTLVRDGVVGRAKLTTRARELQARGRKGPSRILTLLDPTWRHAPVSDTWLEDEFLRIASAAGLPTPRSQIAIATDSTRPRVDFLYDAQRLVVEVDGHATHSTRRQRQVDAEREARLVANGWRVVRFTYEDVTERPAYVVRMVARLLATPA